jgi:hypothetical protein
VSIITKATESLGSLASSDDMETRGLVVAKGGERMAALGDSVLKDNKQMAPSSRLQLEHAVRRLRSNLEMLCGAQKWDDKSKRDKRYFYNKEVAMMLNGKDYKGPK